MTLWPAYTVEKCTFSSIFSIVQKIYKTDLEQAKAFVLCNIQRRDPKWNQPFLYNSRFLGLGGPLPKMSATWGRKSEADVGYEITSCQGLNLVGTGCRRDVYMVTAGIKQWGQALRLFGGCWWALYSASMQSSASPFVALRSACSDLCCFHIFAAGRLLLCRLMWENSWRVGTCFCLINKWNNNTAAYHFSADTWSVTLAPQSPEDKKHNWNVGIYRCSRLSVTNESLKLPGFLSICKSMDRT